MLQPQPSKAYKIFACMRCPFQREMMMYVKSKDSLESLYAPRSVAWQRRRVIYHHPPPPPPLPVTVLLSSREEGEKEAGGGAVLDAVKSKLLEEGHLAVSLSVLQ